MGNSPGPKIRKKGAVGCSGPQNSKMEKKPRPEIQKQEVARVPVVGKYGEKQDGVLPPRPGMLG